LNTKFCAIGAEPSSFPSSTEILKLPTGSVPSCQKVIWPAASCSAVKVETAEPFRRTKPLSRLLTLKVTPAGPSSGSV
jgi:hypothetical protein